MRDICWGNCGSCSVLNPFSSHFSFLPSYLLCFLPCLTMVAIMVDTAMLVPASTMLLLHLLLPSSMSLPIIRLPLTTRYFCIFPLDKPARFIVGLFWLLLLILIQ